jgi:hypothetical protein
MKIYKLDDRSETLLGSHVANTLSIRVKEGQFQSVFKRMCTIIDISSHLSYARSHEAQDNRSLSSA